MTLLFAMPIGAGSASPDNQVGRSFLASKFKRPPIKSENLSTQLSRLNDVDQRRRESGRGPITSSVVSNLPADLAGAIMTKRLRLYDPGHVHVWIHTATDPAQTAGDLARLGAQIQRTDNSQRVVQAVVPIVQLDALAELPSVTFVGLPEYGFLWTGSTTSEGDSILGTSLLRSQLTMNTPVRVGVISDGTEGLDTAQASGDLPAVDTTTCNVVPPLPSSPPPGPLESTDAGAGAEGTAMLEIVHDLAPNAELYFGYFGFNLNGAGTVLDFEAAVNCLAQNTDIVVDDIGWFNIGPYDGTSRVSLNASSALNDPGNPIRGYFTSVGNSAGSHYREPWIDSGFEISAPSPWPDFWEIHRFWATSTTTDAGYGLECSTFVRCGDTVVLEPGGLLIVRLQWNDPFGHSTNDYDLFLQDNFETGALEMVSGNPQFGVGHNPTESFAVVNNHPSTTAYNIIIGNYYGLAAPRTFDMFITCFGCSAIGGDAVIHNFNTQSRSVSNNADAGGGVISVGAINAGDPGHDTIAAYSSQGPTLDNRTKPDITAIDCVEITNAAGFAGNGPFCGTSAAAPHAAAVAALLLSCNPALTTGDPAPDRTQIRSALLDSAVDIGSIGVDNTYGFGRIDTAAAAPLAGCVDSDGDGYPDGIEVAIGKDPIAYCEIMRADLNGDGSVNIFDLQLIASSFGQTIPPAPPRYDQGPVFDSAINIFDLAEIADVFFQQVSGCA